MTTVKKPKETYRETYKRGAAVVRADLLPERFPFTTAGWTVESIEMTAAGRLEDGREFQELRIVTRET